MAANAYVLINIEPAKTVTVVEKLRAIPGAIVHEVMGPYDAVVELESDTPEDITAILRHKIRSVDGVTNQGLFIFRNGVENRGNAGEVR